MVMSKGLSIFTDVEPSAARVDGMPHERECVASCKSSDTSCPNSDCRYWIEYEDDLNCSLIATDRNPSGLTLREVGDRLHISFVRVCQIEKAALEKLKKRIEKPVSSK
jgi:hypothetical protein